MLGSSTEVSFRERQYTLSEKENFYVITDCGPNTDYLNGKKFLTPSFTPTIMHFKINAEGNIEVIEYIKLKNPSGQPITGLPNPAGMGSTGETAYDANGSVWGLTITV